MIASDLLLDIYRVYRGKIDSRAPVWGSDKANVAIDIANRKVSEWATDSRNKWNSMFEINSVGTVSVGTQTYDLDDTFFAPSDYAKIVKTDGSYVEYSIVKAQQRNIPAGQALYVHGTDPKKITFAQDIDASLASGTLYVPGYYVPSSLTASTDVVPVDDPVWLVYSTAAELARNDPAKDDQYAVLAGMANELYLRMSNANNDTGLLQLNTVINGMPMIGDSTESWSQ